MCALPSAANGTALGCLLVILSFLFFRQQDDTPSTVPASRNGFWGVEDAVHTFCEPSYSQTVYAAELWNSLGSLVFVAVGLLLLGLTLRLAPRHSPGPGAKKKRDKEEEEEEEEGIVASLATALARGVYLFHRDVMGLDFSNGTASDWHPDFWR